MSTHASRLSAIAVAIVACTALSGCIIVVHESENASAYRHESMYKETRAITVPHVRGSGIEVETANGAVTISRADRTDVRITAEIRATSRSRLEQTEVVAHRDANGMLIVGVDWADGKRGHNEACSFTIQVPEAIGVRIRTSNGAVKIADLGGPADLDTSNGAITVRGQAGPIHARTTNGRIELTHAADAVTAETTNGSVRVELADEAAGPVIISTSNGRVDLEVGRSFAGVLDARTSNGSIRLTHMAGAITSESRTHARIEFDDQGERSTIDTSNGTIVVRGRERAGDAPDGTGG